MLEFLSDRGRENVKDLPALVQAHFNALGDMYSAKANTKGYINMGTAETRLIDNELIELLNRIHHRIELTPANIHYNKFHGSDEFRESIAEFWSKIIFKDNPNKKITANNIATCAGCSVALEMLATMLCNAGDVILIPAPYYSGFVDDINDRAKVIPVAVHCGIDLEKEVFEKEYRHQVSQGKNVRAILFSSPNNPIGTVYSRKALENILEFAMEKDMDIISDEIYAQTIHQDSTKWISLLSLVSAEYMHRVHVTSSFAKDFALSGFRTGFTISFNPDILKGMETLTYFSCVSSHTQAMLIELLRSPELPDLMKLNREKIHTAYNIIKESLCKMGIKTLPAQAGIFIFADFSAYLEKEDFASEHVLWEKIYKKLKVNISPGQIFGAERPGWFRLCYAHNEDEVKEACRRLSMLKEI